MRWGLNYKNTCYMGFVFKRFKKIRTSSAEPPERNLTSTGASVFVMRSWNHSE